jgi:hypothetical protein
VEETTNVLTVMAFLSEVPNLTVVVSVTETTNVWTVPASLMEQQKTMNVEYAAVKMIVLTVMES